MHSALKPERLFVVIPCRNCEEWIGPCLESLQAQAFSGWQALVADDASTDGTAEAVAPFLADERIRYHRLEDRGWLMGNIVNALNGLDLEPNDVVAILDGDDIIYPQCLERIWEAHNSGYDLVYTDEDIDGQDWSPGKAIAKTLPVRDQLWSFSQLRTFKAYLFRLLDDATFRGPDGDYFKAAGDLSLYLPMAELAGADKVKFIDERLYRYRIHENCNFKVLRQEQLENNSYIRAQSPLAPQTSYFDYTIVLDELDKSEVYDLGAKYRSLEPMPFSVRLVHRISSEDEDSWRAYHNLWVGEGIYLDKEII